MAKKLESKIYTADFILAFVSLGLQFGWTMSGLPPCIELACACWAIMLGVVLHCFWVSTRSWNRYRWIRWIVLFAFPALILLVSWNPIKNQYLKQHSPPMIAASILKRPIELLWYFRIDYVESIPPSTDPNAMRPFRIEADVSGQAYSFPTRLMYYAGLTNTLEGGDSVPLRHEPEKYDVQFILWNLRRQVYLMNPTFDRAFSNVMNSASAQIDEFRISELPAKGTNFIQTIIPPDRQVKVVYEITTNR